MTAQVRHLAFDSARHRVREPHHAECARLILRTRRQMAKRFPMEALRDHAWDVLLQLFISDAEGRETCVKQALLAASLSSTSAMRLIDRLENAALITRTPDETDHRRTIVRLTELGRSALTGILDDIWCQTDR